MERNIRLTISYDGSNYHGFQRQQNALTIQEILEERLSRLFGHHLKITGAGRTDAGVHAWGQVVNFFTTGTIPVERIPAAANGLLPRDIVVKAAATVDADFHARYSAKSKIYIYKVYNHLLPDPFYRNLAWHIKGSLDLAKMRQALAVVQGTHDFSAFRAAGGAAADPVRTMLQTDCRQQSGTIDLLFHGTGFLYHMVRNLTGTLVEIGLGKRPHEDMGPILASKDRNQAGITAPPQGLYLSEIFY
ncbi:tRNA pseudouridine(38-40) synthase TruA [Acetonema longum]|uniref:tRNA pseudouridine synthase A n=1 Tax=Acetonema longum DSM 6540 TaxID=1009370 RepID=F7NF63_9FIRM|nr:tRNA pseudouridine(38-40) synthase TruA [Acetonema longum]EGO65318.1 tRNA pseudouridine synthase A [Acetonema longum DSM 6540]